MNEIKVKYSPLLEDSQIIANKAERYMLCGYSAHFKIMCLYGSLSDAVNWGENIAKDNLKQFIEDNAKQYFK